MAFGGGTGVMAAVAANVRAHDSVVVGVRSDDRRDGASEDSFVPGDGQESDASGHPGGMGRVPGMIGRCAGEGRIGERHHRFENSRTDENTQFFFQDPSPAVYDVRFAAARAKLETTHGDKLSFEPLAGRKGCRIAEYHQGDIANTDQWDDYVEWFVAAQTWLRQAIATIGGLNNVIAP